METKEIVRQVTLKQVELMKIAQVMCEQKRKAEAIFSEIDTLIKEYREATGK